MIRKILALIALCGITWGGCGSGLYEKDGGVITLGRIFDFHYSFNAANAEAKRKFYSGFKCVDRPTQKKEDSVYLTHIDFRSGTYTCEYVLGNSKSVEEQAQAQDKISPENVMLQHQHYAESRNNDSCLFGYTEITQKAYNQQVKAATLNIKPRTLDYIGNISTKIIKETTNKFWFDSITVEHPELKISFAETDDMVNKKLASLIKNSSASNLISKELFENMYKNPNPNPTISEFFSAAVTLDADYFKDTNAINKADGSANFKDAVEFTQKELNLFTSAKSAVSEFFGKDLGLREVSPVSPTKDMMNSKTWGFYIAFIENMRIAEHSIVLMLFFAGFVGFSTQKLVQAGYNHWGDQDSKTDIGWKKMMIAPATTVILFLAPVVPTGLTINDALIKPEGDKVQAGIVLNGGGAGAPSNRDGERMRETTLIQTAIQYFVHWGVLAGNTLADYALYPYLNYLQFSKGAVIGEVVNVYDEIFKHNKQDFLLLQKEVEFYSSFCKPIYGEQDNTGVLIDNALSGRPPLSLAKLTEERYGVANSLGIKDILGANTVSAELCARLETNIHQHSQNAISGFIYPKLALRHTIEKLEAEKAGVAGNNEKILTVQNLVKRMARMQEVTGWTFSAIVPMTYTFYQADVLGETIESQKKATRSYVGAASARHNKVTSNNPSEEESQALLSENSGSTEGTMQALLSSTAYFSFPGFKNIYDIVYELFKNSFDGIMGALTKIGGAGKIITLFLGGAIGKGLVAIGAVFFAVWLYDFILESVSLLSVAMMAIFRIAFYYVEVLIFFVASPAVVIWAVISKKTEVIWHYIGKAAVLTITPILIVLSCYLFIFTVEIINSVYAYLSGLVEAVFLTEQSTLAQTLQVTMVIAIGNTIMKVVHIFIGYVTIIKFNSWFLQTIGVKEGVMEEAAQRISDKTSPLYSPIK